ncbi:MAG: hypothetical protein QM714_03975 [Nocardioides sp.]|uniref:hypothetical protein n=1 Tax=Nocardioides sp. TaxID=35761 RepID=UPI0039E55F40
MRTTVTLDADSEQIVRERMQRDGVSFKRALNDAIRSGATDTGRPPRPDFVTSSVALGRPAFGLDRALQLAAEIEDEELISKAKAAL